MRYLIKKHDRKILYRERGYIDVNRNGRLSMNLLTHSASSESAEKLQNIGFAIIQFLRDEGYIIEDARIGGRRERAI